MSNELYIEVHGRTNLITRIQEAGEKPRHFSGNFDSTSIAYVRGMKTLLTVDIKHKKYPMTQEEIATLQEQVLEHLRKPVKVEKDDVEDDPQAWGGIPGLSWWAGTP